MVAAGSGGLMAGMILAVPGVASAQTVTCGETITASTTLTANLDCSSYAGPAPAITIGASDVTLNLGGHKILGPGDSTGIQGIADGSSTQPGYDYVTVENGSLSNFVDDVYFYGTSSSVPLTGAVVKKVTTTDQTLESSTSVFGEYLSGASITKLTSSDAETAVDLEDGQGNTVSGSNLNSPYTGLFDDGGASNTFSGNTLTNIGFDGFYSNGSTGDFVKTNTMTGSTDGYGVYNDETSYITVTGNKFKNLGSAVADDDGSYGEISNNTGTGDTYGIYTDEASNYSISKNKFSGGYVGIEADYPTADVLTSNTASSNSEVGIYIWSDNDTTDYSAELDTNTGNKNRFGLYSQFVTTGSGNKASGNKVVNCHNVTCTTGGDNHAVSAAPPHPGFAVWRTAAPSPGP